MYHNLLNLNSISEFDFHLPKKKLTNRFFSYHQKMPTKVRIHLKKEEIEGSLVNSIKSIKLISDNLVYAFPEEHQGEKSHKELSQITLIKSAFKSMSKEGHFRNVNITLSDEIKKLYIDEDNNFIFKDFFLEESTEGSLDSSIRSRIDEDKTDTLNNLDLEIKRKENILLDIEKKFNLNKFYGIQQNAAEWLKFFEIECERHKIYDSIMKIQIIRFFLEGNSKEWYRSNLKKISDNDWSKWTKSFLLIYAKRGWAEVRYAYKFKYIDGSIIDYSLKKESLLLDAEPSISEVSKINHIVIGLPQNIQDILDKEEIKNTDQLINILRKYDLEYLKKDRKEIKKKPNDRYVIKTPCYKCEKLGWPNRYHPTAICRNGERYKEKYEINLNENIEGFKNQKN